MPARNLAGGIQFLPSSGRKYSRSAVKQVSIPEMLQMDFNVAIANAKIVEFENQAYRAGGLVCLGLLDRAEAADLLHEAAIYNGLILEYGQDRIQRIMAQGIGGAT